MKVITPPEALPVTVENLADQFHYDDAEAPALTALLTAAVAVVEVATNRPMMARTVEVELPEGDWREFWLPCAPAIALGEASEGVTLLRAFDEPRLRNDGISGESVLIRVGHEDPDAILPQLRQAVILLVMEWREASVSIGEQYHAPELSFGFRHLLRQIRYRRPMVSV